MVVHLGKYFRNNRNTMFGGQAGRFVPLSPACVSNFAGAIWNYGWSISQSCIGSRSYLEPPRKISQHIMFRLHFGILYANLTEQRSMGLFWRCISFCFPYINVDFPLACWFTGVVVVVSFWWAACNGMCRTGLKTPFIHKSLNTARPMTLGKFQQTMFLHMTLLLWFAWPFFIQYSLQVCLTLAYLKWCYSLLDSFNISARQWKPNGFGLVVNWIDNTAVNAS